MKKKTILFVEHDEQDWIGTLDRLDNFKIDMVFNIKSILGHLDLCISEIRKIDLDEFEAVFLDVYFWHDKEEFASNSAKDEAYQLLDILRSRAPWLPVIAYTQHLDGKLTYEISRRQYDAIVPKQMIKRESSFSLQMFNHIVENAVKCRQKIANASDFIISSDKKKEYS